MGVLIRVCIQTPNIDVFDPKIKFCKCGYNFKIRLEKFCFKISPTYTI